MICCLVLAYNEELYLLDNLKNIEELFDRIIIVNDCSTDGTENILSKLDNTKYDIITNNKNMGAGKSMEIGIKKFLELDMNYLIKVDGDGQFKTEDIKELIRLSKSNFDFIKGDRFWDKGIEGNIPLIRYVGNSLASLLIKISTGNWKMNDPLNGLFLFSVKSLDNFSIPKIFKRYGYPFFVNIFMNNKILINDLKVGQIKNTIKYRQEESKLRPSTMFLKLIIFTVASFTKKIKEKFKFSTLQLSALLDVLFLLFSASTIYSIIKLILIIFNIALGSKASWLFLTFILLIFSLLSFLYSQLYEKKIYEKKYIIL